MSEDSVPQWLQNLVAGWPMIRANLPTFIILAVLIFGVVWWVMDWRYGGIIANRDAEISTIKSQRDDYKEKLNGATPEQAKAALDATRKPEAIKDQPLIPVYKKLFRNERVVLDGHRFSDCIFENVTLVYNGGQFEFVHNTIRGYSMASDMPVINSAMSVLFELGMLKGPALRDGEIVNPSGNTFAK